MTPADFEKKFPKRRFKRTALTIVPDADAKEQGEVDTEVVVVEPEKQVSRVGWLIAGALTFAVVGYAFRRWGPQAPPQQVFMAPAAAPVDPETAAIAELLGE